MRTGGEAWPGRVLTWHSVTQRGMEAGSRRCESMTSSTMSTSCSPSSSTVTSSLGSLHTAAVRGHGGRVGCAGGGTHAVSRRAAAAAMAVTSSTLPAAART